jgi:hypothetical protein
MYLHVCVLGLQLKVEVFFAKKKQEEVKISSDMGKKTKQEV